MPNLMQVLKDILVTVVNSSFLPKINYTIWTESVGKYDSNWKEICCSEWYLCNVSDYVYYLRKFKIEVRTERGV